jgi:hypothetical protein
MPAQRWLHTGWKTAATRLSYPAAVLVLIHWAALHNWGSWPPAAVHFGPLIALWAYRLWYWYLRPPPAPRRGLNHGTGPRKRNLRAGFFCVTWLLQCGQDLLQKIQLRRARRAAAGAASSFFGIISLLTPLTIRNTTQAMITNLMTAFRKLPIPK